MTPAAAFVAAFFSFSQFLAPVRERAIVIMTKIQEGKPWRNIIPNVTIEARIRPFEWEKIWEEISFPRLPPFFSLETRVITIPAVTEIINEGSCVTKPPPIESRL